MRVFYRLSPSEAMQLPAAEFFALAYRLPAYPGVLQAKTTQSPVANEPEVRMVPGTREAIMANPDLSAVISFGGT